MDDDERRQRLGTLTAEQRTIFRLLCDKRPRLEIAQLRSMSVAGVDYHCTQIAQKLGLQESIGRRNAVAFRLALLEFLPISLQLEAEQIPPPPAAEEAEAAEQEAQPSAAPPAADPAVLALVDQMAASGQQGEDQEPGTLEESDLPASAGTSARQALWRWWRPLAFFIVLALVAGMAGGIAAAHLVGGGPAVPPAGPLPAGTTTASATTALTSLSGGASIAARLPTSTPTPGVGAVQAPPTPSATALASAVATTATVAPTTTPTTSVAAVQRPASAGPAPAPTVIVSVAPAATPLDLAGKVASDTPGTPLVLGHSISSVLDPTTKSRDVYTITLPAGERFHPVVTASSTRFTVTFAPTSGHDVGTLCDGLSLSFTCAPAVPIAAGGSYQLVIGVIDESLRYTLQPTTVPIAVPSGVVDLVGRVASNIPGTPLRSGQPVLSVVDDATKPLDVYALHLQAGQMLHVQVSAVPARETVRLLPPGTAPFTGAPPAFSGTELCDAVINLGQCDATTPIAATGAYTLIVATDTLGVQYTVQATAQ